MRSFRTAPLKRRAVLCGIGSFVAAVGCNLLAACGGTTAGSASSSRSAAPVAAAPSAATPTSPTTATSTTHPLSSSVSATSAPATPSTTVAGSTALTAAAAPAGAGVTLQYYTSLNARQATTFPQFVTANFQKAYPNLKLETIQAGSPYDEKLKTLMAGGTPPDVAWLLYPDAYQNRLIQDITPYVQRDKYDLSVFPKADFDVTCQWRGHICGMPNQGGGNWPVIAYNRDLFQKLGVAEPPSTWGDPSWTADAWLQTLQKTTKVDSNGAFTTAGISQIGAGVLENNWPSFWNAKWISDDMTTIVCDTAEMIRGMQFLFDLATKYKVMVDSAGIKSLGASNATDALVTGKLAMLQVSAGSTFTVAQAVQQQGVNLAFAPLPTFAIYGSAYDIDPNNLPTGSKHADEAWTFMKWSSDTPYWCISRGNAPAREDQFPAWTQAIYATIAAKVHLDVYAQSLKYAARIDPLFLLPTYDQMHKELLAPAFTRMYAGTAAVATTMQGLKSQLQALVPKTLPD